MMISVLLNLGETIAKIVKRIEEITAEGAKVGISWLIAWSPP
jgi:hypothetical protein